MYNNALTRIKKAGNLIKKIIEFNRSFKFGPERLKRCNRDNMKIYVVYKLLYKFASCQNGGRLSITKEGVIL